MISTWHDTISIGSITHLNEVNLRECLQTGRPKYIQDGDYVLVVEVLQDLYLPQCSKAEHRVIERRYPFDCNFSSRGYMRSTANNPICTFSCVRCIIRI